MKITRLYGFLKKAFYHKTPQGSYDFDKFNTNPQKIHSKILQLIDLDADIKRESPIGKLLIHVERSSKELIELYIKGKIFGKSNLGQLKCFIQKKQFFPEYRNHNNETILMRMIESRDIESAKYLAEKYKVTNIDNYLNLLDMLKKTVKIKNY